MQLEHRVEDWLTHALKTQERASLAVSGGRTPVAFFTALSELELSWSRIDITLADERWVNIDDEASNERLVRLHLLRNRAKAARFVGLKVDTDTPEQALALCERQLGLIHWPLDVVVLGMGNDGHTASLFPGTDALKQALALDNSARCAAIRPLDVPHPRMTMTRAALTGARHRALHMTGEDKLETLEEALMDVRKVELMPIRAFLQADLDIYWSP